MFTGLCFAQLSPGDLHNSHSDFEGLKNCERCHEAGKKISTAKCLDCHKILAERVRSGKGLHSNDGYDDCVACHVEHIGRDNELIWWVDGKEEFDHKLAGFELSGKHSKLDCRKCHINKHIQNREVLLKAGKKLDYTFLGLNKKCLSCHFDEHRGQLKTECLTCHVMDAWKPASAFDHNTAKFPLAGKHVNLECGKCHKPITDNDNSIDPEYLKFTQIEHNNCNDCHNDVHKGKFERSCKSCHTVSGWRNVNTSDFDHSQTKYPLQGKHNDLKCEQCHNSEKAKADIKYAFCIDCHDDNHKGQFTQRESKGECGECHTVNGFSPSLYTIDMHSKSDYPLEESHLAVPCFLCHAEQLPEAGLTFTKFQFNSTNCNVCHADRHSGSVDKFTNEKGCELCHSLSGWSSIDYDHSAHGFKLEGKHALIKCTHCHKTDDTNGIEETLKFSGLNKECLTCHLDTHRGQFTGNADIQGTTKNETRCQRCHTPGNWFPDLFDHNRDSSFKLDGAHKKAKCGGCHKKIEKKNGSFVWFKPVEQSCESCHSGNNNILKENRP